VVHTGGLKVSSVEVENLKQFERTWSVEHTAQNGRRLDFYISVVSAK
jgi:hypothetical protein